jgi:hypothetical protein
VTKIQGDYNIFYAQNFQFPEVNKQSFKDLI